MIARLHTMILFSLLACSPGLTAGQLTVSPLTLSMTHTQPNAVYKLKNGSNEDSFYQLQLFAWEQKDGKTQLKQQNDLVISPPVSLIPGKGEQTVRIIRQRPTTSDNELSYRLIISEIPDTETAQGANVRVLLRMSLPVFVGGEGLQPNLSVSYDNSELVIHNTGGKHAKISDVSWSSQPSNKVHPIQNGLAGYALPNRALRISLPEAIPTAEQPYLSALVNGDPTTLQIEIASPNGTKGEQIQ